LDAQPKFRSLIAEWREKRLASGLRIVVLSV